MKFIQNNLKNPEPVVAESPIIEGDLNLDFKNNYMQQQLDPDDEDDEDSENDNFYQKFMKKIKANPKSKYLLIFLAAPKGLLLSSIYFGSTYLTSSGLGFTAIEFLLLPIILLGGGYGVYSLIK